MKPSLIAPLTTVAFPNHAIAAVKCAKPDDALEATNEAKEAAK